MQDLEAFLNTELAKLPEFQHDMLGQQPRRPIKKEYEPIQPDANGNIYEVCGLCGVTLDCVSQYSDAEYLASREHHAWSFYQIWQINIASGERILVSQKEIRRQANPLGLAAHNATLLTQRKGQG